MRSHLVRSAAAAIGGALGLMALASVAQAQELLTNANLDNSSVSSQTLATPTSWTVSANKSLSGPFTDGASSEGFANFPGTGSGLFFKAFQGNGTTGDKITVDLFQDVAGVAGQTYLMTGYAGAGAGYIGLSDPTVSSVFRIDFLNGSGVQIGSSSLDLIAAGLRTSGLPNAFGYNQYSLTGTAPAGTATVRAHVRMGNAYGNPLGGDQAFVVDTFSLTAVPEPTTLGLASLAGMGLMIRRRK